MEPGLGPPSVILTHAADLGNLQKWQNWKRCSPRLLRPVSVIQRKRSNVLTVTQTTMSLDLTHIDLFSGIGGFALAARWSGFRTIAFCEENPFCRRVLIKHWPDTPIINDVRDFDGTRHLYPTLLTGGTPCQPFSRAGKRRGHADDRYLWPEMLRVISEARPAWIIAENVTGIIGVELDKTLSDLEGENYDPVTYLVPACAVDAPHERKRIWVVAHSNSPGFREQRWPCPITASLSVPECASRWTAEPDVCRVDDGVPNRVAKLRALGNSIVPQVAYQFIKKIASIETLSPQSACD